MRKFILFLTVLMIPALALAQAQTTGRVTGKVVDEEGNPVVNARVVLTSSALQGEREVRTNERGEFLAALLPVGPYAVEVTAPGYQPVTVSFRLGVGQTVPLNLVLKKGEEVVEEVTVYSTATPLETTALGANFDYSETVEELPIQNRDIQAVAAYAPNMSFGPTPGTLAISGAPSFDTVVLLDGAEVSDPYFGTSPPLWLEDAIEEVQVLTSGVSARYGRFQGGVLNAITKTGGNTFDGSVREELSKESWNSKTPFGEDQSDELNHVEQGTLGGYILKDRLWFFGGVRLFSTDSAATTTVTNESFTTSTEDDRFQLKLRGAITPDHVVEVNRLDRDRDITNRAGLPAGNLEAANGKRKDPDAISTLVYQGVITPNFFVDFQATKKDVEIKSGGDPSAGDPFFDFSTGSVFNNHWWDFTDPSVRDNETVGVNLTQALTTSDWGSHTLEYGVQYVKNTTGGDNRQSSTGFNLLAVPIDIVSAPFWGGVNSNGEDVYNVLGLYEPSCFVCQVNYRWEALPLGGDQELENLAVYAQDTWEIGKWRFDVGFRYDDYDGSGPLPQFNLAFDDIAPRLGITYNIDQNWQVQGTWGKYVSRFNDGVANEITGVSSAPRLETLYLGDSCWADPALNVGNTLSDGVTPIDPDGDGCDADDIAAILRDAPPGGSSAAWPFFTDVNDPQQPTRFLDANIEAPHANDMNFSVKRALPRNTGAVTFTYTHREFKDLIDDFAGRPCDFGFNFGQPCPAGNTVTIVDPNNAPLATVDSIVWANADQAQRRYEAFTLTADWRPSAKWNLGGNWTFSETTGNYEGEGRNTPASGSAIGDWVQTRPEEAAVPFGFLDEDITHRVLAWGTYRFNFNRAGALSLGGIFRYRSGSRWSRTATVSRSDPNNLYASEPSRYTHFFDGRGNNRFSGFWALDFAARYQFPIYRDLNGWVKVDVTNVLNNDELISFQTNGIATTVNGVLTWQPQGNCGVNDPPSTSCTGFGRIRNEGDYQTPRTYLLTVGLQF